jgi:hypothetical protein
MHASQSMFYFPFFQLLHTLSLDLPPSMPSEALECIHDTIIIYL